MADDRTPEQKSADEALNSAVLACIEAYGMANPGEMVTSFAVLCSVIGIDDAGDDTSGIIKLLKDGRMRWQDQFGLFAMAQANLKRQYLDD